MSLASGLTSPRWSPARSVSPHDCWLDRASTCGATPLTWALDSWTERVIGKSVITPPRSLVIGCCSYWLITGTSGPTPKRRPIGLSSMTTSLPRVIPYLVRYLASPSAWKGSAMKKTLPPLER
ncbi:MAG: hypothetical protein DME10_20470 [Candidatus Rokuibacteriota bacterium]|nr:MAG: hypothetical protein DME10_20470 [Candidatus Rokubacteria bacterium]